jgi:hypothetical protein
MDIILEDTKKYIRDVASTRVENVIHYIYIYFKPRVIGKHRKDIGKAPNCFLKVIKNIKKDIMGAKNINVLVSEN